jgi:hypothetical protein
MPIHEFYPVLARSPELQREVLSAGSTLPTAAVARAVRDEGEQPGS